MSEFINTIDLLGDDAVMDSIIDRTITELKDDKLTTVGAFAFYACSALSEIDLPNVGTVNSASFMNCGNLTNVEMPQLTRVAGSAFIGTGLNRIHFPLVTQIDAEAFSGSGVTLADFPVCTVIAAKAFFNCPKLASLILRSTTMCTLANVNAFTANWDGGYGPIYNGTGYIYVPRALVDSYKAATNWSTYAAQFRAIEDYSVDGTITGEIDPDKYSAMVTDGLVLSMDYSGHVGDTSDTITDLASGLSFKNFSQFEKQENGITSPSNTYEYLDVVANDEKTAFLAKMKETGGFTLESFGTRFVPSFYAPNYNMVMHTGNAGGWGTNHTGEFVIPATAGMAALRILQDGSSDRTALNYGSYTLGGLTMQMNNAYISKLFPHIEEFRHIVMTYSADGHADCYVNGVKGDAPITVDNFQAWGFDTMFGGQWSLLNTVNTPGVTTAHRIYNRVLTDAEVRHNMLFEYDKMKQGRGE